jgi:hypothetical protein
MEITHHGYARPCRDSGLSQGCLGKLLSLAIPAREPLKPWIWA